MMFSYILYGFIWLVSFLPLRLLYLFSDVCYYLLYYLAGYRRKVVRNNLRNSFPDKSEAELKRIEKKYYRHMCDVFVELYKFWHISAKEISRRCVFKNPEVLQKHFDQGKGVIGVLGHYCNWEWMVSYTLHLTDVDFYPLYKPVHNKVMDKMMLHIRSRFGSHPVPKNDILRLIVKNKQIKKPFLAAFIADQTPNAQNLNFWMDFLNQDTPVFVGTERIATKFNLPVISLSMKKVKRGYYEVEFFDLCEEPAKLEPGELTQMHTRLLESCIKENPEYWLWSHKRWKHRRTASESPLNTENNRHV